MVEVADIFRLHGPEYRSKFGDRMLPSHLRAMRDIEHCRTEALGGQLYTCANCQDQRYRYHSCKNRHCPKCQNDQANEWLEKQQNLLLPVTHFMVTFTLPEELRSVARANQKIVYNLLFRASSEALQQLALDPRFIGGRIGMVGVLHTWTRDLRSHPHVHYLVTGGGLTADGRWNSSRPDFLVPVKALSPIFRAKFRDQLKKTEIFNQVDEQVWTKAWVVHSQPVGSGQPAFKYLAPYVFRVAISNNRILKIEDGQVTFNYKESAPDQLKFCTVPAEEFIRRFLQHVLPDRFIKVRYYGLLSPGNRELLNQARESLGAGVVKSNPTDRDTDEQKRRAAPCCPSCGTVLTLIPELQRRSGLPPCGISMLNNLDRDQHKALPRQRQIQSPASRKECARLKKLLQKSARHCPDRSHPVGQLRNEQLKNVEEIAFAPDNLPISTSAPVEEQLFPLSTRCSNSR